MATATEIEITSTAKEAVLYANTPSFLLDKLRKDSSVRQLLETCRPSEIATLLKGSGRAGSPIDLTRKYVLLVALVTGDWGDRWEALRDISLEDLEWGNMIVDITQAENVPTASSSVIVSSGQPANSQTFTWGSAPVGRR